MDTEVKSCRSLPPLVEGKVYGSLKLNIDEVFWTRKSPGPVTVVASWWGEQDSAQFRPIDSATNVEKTDEDISEVYTVKTTITLFEEYIKNCETIELVIITEKTHEIIGTAHVGELLKIFVCKSYSQYAPILSNSGNRIGEIHVSLQLTHLLKSPNMQLKTSKYNKRQIDSDTLLSVVDKCNKEIQVASCKDAENITTQSSVKLTKVDAYDTYRSVLKDKRPEFQESRKKHNGIITDKLVAQVVARAQRLRGAILKETYNEDPLALSDSSMSNEVYPASAENEAKLYEYILGKEMTSSEKKTALDTLRSTSPTPSLIDFASKTIADYKYGINNNMDTKSNENSPVESNNSTEDAFYNETTHIESKGAHPLDYVDSIRIIIKSFTLSPAGYRRAKSTCLQHGIPLSSTYFVQYDATFGTRQRKIKSNRENKSVRTYAKRQVSQVVDFNYKDVHAISRHIINKDFLLKFKIFVRHLNQKLPAELGYGSMNVFSDIVHTTDLSSTQRITIVNKGLKIGELKVTAELGCDLIHFGREFVDAVMSAKENIPVLKIKSPIGTYDSRYKSVTGAHSSKSSSKVSSVSVNRIECLTNDNNKNLITARDIAEHRERNLDNKKIDTINPETSIKDKVLLHGLIYVAEGKDLPEFNTYLICRAFWREDKATSEICNDTKNPFYHFCQLVPLIHGTELLERIRDNYIIIEVYSRQNNSITDNLLGIAKLPVHQLYVAYRDPLVLPHLLLSKYPVISVDGWVSINDPVSGRSCGQLLALVALGTAEQIALLERTKGLRNINTQTVSSHQCCISDDIKHTMSGQESSKCEIEMQNCPQQQFARDNFAYRVYGTSDRDTTPANCRNQEIQTDISVLKNNRTLEAPNREDTVTHGLVDNSTNACALHVNKNGVDQSAQTELERANEEKIDREELCLNTLNSHVLSDDNDSCSPRNNFQISPTDMYRSVGVGAEYDEESDQQQATTYNNISSSSVTEGNAEKDTSNANCDSIFFRTIVEIECALHLPKIEIMNESMEPSTYVTFQNLTAKHSAGSQINSYMVTNVYPHSCNPKWNWRCDAKLPTDLLLNHEKRLILKVWHLIDPDTATGINLEKDAVIGFAAVDLSVLMAGFPTVSGWFHILDFSGKCNGQIKINITPLDSLPPFEKFASTGGTNLSGCSDLSHANWPYNAPYNNTDLSSAQQMLYASHSQTAQCVQNNTKPDESTCVVDTSHKLENVSMSILSLSLKQKLDELNEITKRLQSRLHDVTNTAFEEDFDSDFEINESNSEIEYNDNRKAEASKSAPIVVHSTETSRISKQQSKTQSDQNVVTNETQTLSLADSSNFNSQLEFGSNRSVVMNPEAQTDTGYSSGSNTHLSQYSRHYQSQNPCSSAHNYLADSKMEYPARGTKTHINHLLDKLSLDLPPKLPPGAEMPMKRDIISLFTKLREHRNNLQEKEKSYGITTCSVPTQTDSSIEQRTYSHATNGTISDTSEMCVDENVPRSSEESQSRNKISTVIREELVAEENDDAEWDELTTYLINTNIRYRNLDGVVNPLLYQHLVPDLQIASAVSPEEEAVEQLDSRYARSFNKAINRPRINQPTPENNVPLQVDAQTKDRMSGLDSDEGMDLLRLTPSGVSGNVSGNIDVTVVHKHSDNDLTSGNNAEATTVSTRKSASLLEKLSVQQSTVKTEEYRFTISETSVPGVSRQAPDGGNPVEEIKTVTVQRQDDEDEDAISDQLKLSDT